MSNEVYICDKGCEYICVCGGGEFSYELKRLEIANERMWNEVEFDLDLEG